MAVVTVVAYFRTDTIFRTAADADEAMQRPVIRWLLDHGDAVHRDSDKHSWQGSWERVHRPWL